MLISEGCHQGEHQCCAVLWVLHGQEECLTTGEGTGSLCQGGHSRNQGWRHHFRVQGVGRGMEYDVVVPLESASTVTHFASSVWHSIHFTFGSYCKIEPFFIEK